MFALKLIPIVKLKQQNGCYNRVLRLENRLIHNFKVVILYNLLGL